ncbi:hypothetical protein [Aquimarina pacifica]|uniref:hypothetical protein n=1 Tax=Aquimarina pacifica TaxID=1296415 RepID=UPI0004720DBE|nr:hypothetical protein [Aquimarina pacifica]
MQNEEQRLREILKKFNGLDKIKAYDLTHKIETLLFYASNPIDADSAAQLLVPNTTVDYDIDPFHFTILPNGNFCEFEGSNNWLHLYKENKRILPNWAIFDTYYFKTKYAPLELIKLTKKNLLENIHGTDKEPEILMFLKKNSVTKKDIVTDKLLLLDV